MLPMMRSRFSPTLFTSALSLAALFAACRDAAGPESVPPATFSAASASGGGAFVMRQELPSAVFLVDQDAGLTLFLGGTLQDLAEACAIGGTPEPIDWETVLRPTGALHVLAKGTQDAVVWGVASDGFCEDLLVTTPLATGQARSVYTDNDYTVNGPGGNSFGARIYGMLNGAQPGEVFHLLSKWRLVINGDGQPLEPIPPTISLTQVR